MAQFSDVDLMVEDFIQRERIPGLALVVLRGDEAPLARGYGVTSVEDGGIPVTPQTLFRIGSVSKPLAGTAIMRLVERGQLDLDTPISHYLGWLAFDEPGAAERITLRMLLSHTAGLPKDTSAGARASDGSDGSDGLERHVREQLPRSRFVAPPGALFSYSNIGVNLAGYLAQVASGLPFPRLMQTALFDPLAMRRTTFDPLVAMTYPLALPHTLKDDGTLRVIHHFPRNSAYDPAGGAYSCADDLAHFVRMHLAEGTRESQPLLSSGTLALMRRSDTPTYNSSPEDGYGLTFETGVYNEHHWVGHHGVMGSFGCQLLMIPEQRIACIVLLNRQPRLATPIAFEVIERLLDHAATHPAPDLTAPDSAAWARYTGVYLGDRTGLARMTLEDDQLVLAFQQQRVTLQPYCPGVFTGSLVGGEPPLTVAFRPLADDPAHFLIINREVHRRIELDSPVAFDSHTLQRYTGRYCNGEGYEAETITIRLEDGSLVLTLLDNNANTIEGALTPLDATRFYWFRGLIEFQMEPDGTASALLAMGVYLFARVENS